MESLECDLFFEKDLFFSKFLSAKDKVWKKFFENFAKFKNLF